jgi:hypothetical protein
MSNPLADALSALRAEVALAEQTLADLDRDDAPTVDRLVAAGEVHVARRRAEEAERSVPGAARAHRAEVAVEHLAALFEPIEGVPVEPEPVEPAVPGVEDPLAALFA